MGGPHVMAAAFALVDLVHPSQYPKVTIKPGQLGCPINGGEQKRRIADVQWSDGSASGGQRQPPPPWLLSGVPGPRGSVCLALPAAGLRFLPVTQDYL